MAHLQHANSGLTLWAGSAAAALQRDVASYGYALAEAAFGGIGLFVAALWDLLTRLAGDPLLPCTRVLPSPKTVSVLLLCLACLCVGTAFPSFHIRLVLLCVAVQPYVLCATHALGMHG